ncbi:MAG: hypothetical protein JHD16_05240 [Solirubrobacteraceae bacterium]|nr:hypothetical protein [Solirubrobacteraceae bacterium]
MARFTKSSTTPAAGNLAVVPTRRAYADSAIGYLPSKPRLVRTFTPAADDPLAALEAELTAKETTKAASINSHGKPLGGIPVFGGRRAPARRAAFRTPPR